jgi:2,3,4,5-tetrahydropyridine-2,6-dicarboxylate N-succinyltransferase
MSTHLDGLPHADLADLERMVMRAWEDRRLLAEPGFAEAVRAAVDLLDQGALRVAEPPAGADADWTVNEWVQQAVLLYFAVAGMDVHRVGPFEYHDKIPLKRGWTEARRSGRSARDRPLRRVHRARAWS